MLLPTVSRIAPFLKKMYELSLELATDMLSLRVFRSFMESLISMFSPSELTGLLVVREIDEVELSVTSLEFVIDTSKGSKLEAETTSLKVRLKNPVSRSIVKRLSSGGVVSGVNMSTFSAIVELMGVIGLPLVSCRA